MKNYTEHDSEQRESNVRRASTNESVTGRVGDEKQASIRVSYAKPSSTQKALPTMRLSATSLYFKKSCNRRHPASISTRSSGTTTARDETMGTHRAKLGILDDDRERKPVFAVRLVRLVDRDRAEVVLEPPGSVRCLHDQSAPAPPSSRCERAQEEEEDAPISRR